MTTPNILPTDWHRGPDSLIRCPICGYWGKGGEHRAVTLRRNATARWVVKVVSRTGNVRYKYLGERPQRKPGPKPGTVHRPKRTTPSPKVAEGMGKVIAMVAHGKSEEEAAKAIGLSGAAVAYWKEHWTETWAALMDRAEESMAVAVRAMAGTDKILGDPDRYMEMARAVDQWATKKGVELFPAPDGEMTLCRFYNDWYLPNRLGDASEKTRLAYGTTLRHWRLLTGDPPVKEITTATLSRFRDALLKMRGKKRHLPMSPNSVRTYMKHLQTLLDKLGPPGRGNRDALDILARVPWTKPPREVQRIPRIIAIQQLSDCIMASVAMEVPRIPGVKAPAWWRALLTVAWNTGLRIGTLLSMWMDDIDWRNCRLLLPAARMKSRRPFIMHLNEAAMAALRSIRTNRELVFPWPHARRDFYKYVHRLEDAAGIPRKDQFGFHTIRKTVATLLYEVNPGAAQFALGHTTNDVTKKRYVDGGGLVARALDQLPQPEAFPRKPGDDAA